MKRINKARYAIEKRISELVLSADAVKAIAMTEGICLAEIDRAIDKRCVKCEYKHIETDKSFDCKTLETVIRARASCKMVACKHDVVIPQPQNWAYPVGSQLVGTSNPFDVNIQLKMKRRK